MPVVTSNTSGAFIDPDLHVAGAPEGPLTGLTVAVKDLFDVAGHPTGFGNPRWLKTHKTPSVTAHCVQALQDAGASICGKTHMDEIAYSLQGENFHYGTPINPACPDRIPGGSSSGSVVAAADGTVDIGLGSDTGGSVRVPGSFCGILGIRTTHGRIDKTGVVPLAHTFDIVGWHARSPEVMRSVASVLLPQQSRNPEPLQKWIMAKDAFAAADAATTRAISAALSPAMDFMTDRLGKPQEVAITDGLEEGSLVDWYQAFKVIQAYECWQSHGDWVRQHKPIFGPGIAERMQTASQLTPEQVEEQAKRREHITAHMQKLTASGTIIALPTTPGPAPLKGMPNAQMDDYRTRMLALTCPAGLARLPQVTLPVAKVDGCPVGLSFIGPSGSDEALLSLAADLTHLLKLTCPDLARSTEQHSTAIGV